MNYLLGLGSNVGQREHHISKARTHLGIHGIVVLKASSIYESQPVDVLDQPWFLNQVLEVVTPLPPVPLLDTVKKIEVQLGRTASFSKGPRVIDIDILLHEDKIFRNRNLTIPHPSLHKRKFVLAALNEIAPDRLHPVLEVTIGQLWKTVMDTSEVKIYSGSSKS